MFRSIRWRIAIIYTSIVFLAMAALTAYFSSFVRQTYLADLKAQLTAEANLLSDALTPILSEDSPVQDIQPLAKRWGNLLGARVTIIRVDGTVLGDSHENPEVMDNHLGRPEVQQALAEGVGISIRYSRTMGYRMMYVAVPVKDDGKIMGIARVALPLTQIEANVGRFRQLILAASLTIALLTGILVFIITERITRRLRELVSLVERVAHGDLNARIFYPSRDELGQLAMAFNRMGDELQARMQALAERQNTLSNVLNYMTDGVVIIDGAGLIKLLNPAAAKILGLSEKEAIGQSFPAAVRHSQIIEIWRQCQEKCEEQSDTFELNNYFLQAIFTPLGDKTKDGCLALFRDLTQIRRLETIRRDFIANISHELRTPMAALKALVETLKESALEDLPAAKRFIKRMDEEVESLTKLVEELLELSKIEAGQAPMRLAPISLTEILLPPLERLRIQIERANLTLTVDLPPDLPLVLADAEQMQRVVTNLLHNAIKFTPPGGRITVRAYLVEQREPEVVVEIADTGIGIPPEHLPRIFERFYKVDRARAGGGTGLGLAIAKHVVQAHGGRIWAESTEGQGSTFYFTLPVCS